LGHFGTSLKDFAYFQEFVQEFVETSQIRQNNKMRKISKKELTRK
jgi:hypothetical protein